MLWFCQWVTLAISVKVAPLGRRRSSRIVAFFDPSRASVAGGAGFLLSGVAAFFGAAFLAPMFALGASFPDLASRFEVAFFVATGVPGSATEMGRTGFFAAWAGLAAFFGAVCLARLLAFGSPFFRLAALFAAAFSGATWAPWSAAAAVLVLVVASVFVIVVVILGWRLIRA